MQIPVDITTDGFQGAKMAGERQYDCILMDMQMPVMGGCNLYLTKPIDRNELVRIVSEQLSLTPVMS